MVRPIRPSLDDYYVLARSHFKGRKQKKLNQAQKRWLEELRRGDRKQIKSFLHRHDGFCCLGVLCDIEHDGYWMKSQDEADVRFCLPIEEYPWFLSGQKLTGFWGVSHPPNDILSKVRLKVHDSQIIAGLNDKGATFEEIADFLEEVWLGKKADG